MIDDDQLTDDEWRVKAAFDLGGVDCVAPNKYMLGDEDVTNQVISIILKRQTIQRQAVDASLRMIHDSLPNVIPAVKPWNPEDFKCKIVDVEPKPKVKLRHIIVHLIKKCFRGRAE